MFEVFHWFLQQVKCTICVWAVGWGGPPGPQPAPRPAFRAAVISCLARQGPTRASAADQGVRPTIVSAMSCALVLNPDIGFVSLPLNPDSGYRLRPNSSHHRGHGIIAIGQIGNRDAELIHAGA